MTDEQINIAIAETCGWLKFTQFTTYPKSWSWGRTPARYHKPIWSLTSLTDMREDECTKYGWHGDGYISIDHIPDYCNDLNTMHQLINRMKRPDYIEWALNLTEICGSDDAYSASAKKQAEAFLKTIGKWKEDQ
jgi:hypothetical protein